MKIKLLSVKGAFNAPVIKAYLPRINRINDPLIPGKIMAQIAIEPLKKIFKYEFSELTGISDTRATPTIVPNKN